MRIERAADLDGVSAAVSDALLDGCRALQAEGAVPCIVLTGGSGGARVLQDLAAHPRLGSVDWGRVRFLWGDERWVPQGHEDRNDLLADATLFAAVEVDPELVHRMPACDSGLSLDQAAAAYARLVAGIARIDFGLSGVGPDGHVASLFPGREDLLRDGPGVPDAIPVRDSPKPPSERISLTLPALCRAERTWLIAAGAAKADAVSRIAFREQPLLPGARLRGRTETVLWADAAALAGTHPPA
ncbi:6-phosphogluconolactonase [Leucobacter triazinivorans]|uniref:6-phosphogluconolactonase n=1 Tax=Leucobacter triazinivorans TaxID=1784719 RepID=A0A4V0Z1Z4_9MICO|nr:6-phosphogluconolactonase [Leucobacter triazinivorans]QBE50119.1 6-phosphogluconolactonase [Leucobacter triazinivorans]